MKQGGISWLTSDEEKVVREVGAKFLSRVKTENDIWTIDAGGVYYRDLNTILRALTSNGAKRIELNNIYGQRYIGTDLETDIEIDIHGVPGNDLGAFMSGPTLVVHGNAQDACGNTMNDGQIIIHGDAGDIAGYSMRGGKMFIRGDAGYRIGIHMKEYRGKKPYVVVGGTTQDFLGEYMAGGVLVVLGLNQKNGKRHKARFVGTGMHGGTIILRDGANHLGREVKAVDLDKEDWRMLRSLVQEFCEHFGFKADKILNHKFIKLVPVSSRPYGDLYA